ncbi:DUF2759 domain-containing protein [Falsibacillus albus]|uniref:DUF2759 domain-containing protein n=1 Tax=Falsibacillus albus TaxID=2478915 RepID=A0A3L7K7G2_9BACI|nr:DUF2759 domain-containing protein [Falsibacillus albus]RLQ98239.1 DUF2759 domain-containing protein [Falsibacillus albus]
MGLVIIFALVALLAVFASVNAFKTKNLLGIIFGLGALGIFGWFSFMTVVHHGFPAITH